MYPMYKRIAFNLLVFSHHRRTLRRYLTNLW